MRRFSEEGYWEVQLIQYLHVMSCRGKEIGERVVEELLLAYISACVC